MKHKWLRVKVFFIEQLKRLGLLKKPFYEAEVDLGRLELRMLVDFAKKSKQRMKPRQDDGMISMTEINANEPLRKGEILLSKAEADAWNRDREQARIAYADPLDLYNEDGTLKLHLREK